MLMTIITSLHQLSNVLGTLDMPVAWEGVPTSFFRWFCFHYTDSFIVIFLFNVNGENLDWIQDIFALGRACGLVIDTV
jgi:hypothetical protein